MRVSEFSRNNGGVRLDAGLRLGIELEVENGTTPDAIVERRNRSWSITDDGSLRTRGMEFISNPLTWQGTVQQMRNFYSWYERYGYESTVRTSTHVHANVLHMDTSQVGAVCAVHALLEPILFRFCGSVREENIYCVPWYRAPDQCAHVRNMMDGFYRSLNDTCKYSSLYLQPIIRFGTLEFRHAPLFEELGQAMLWMRLVRSIVYDTVEKYSTPDEVLEAVDRMGVDEFIVDLLGEDLTNDLMMYCQEPFEQIIDEADSYSVMEFLCPSLCTYKATNFSWDTGLASSSDDAGVRGYRHVAFSRPPNGLRMQQPMYAIEPDEMLDEMDEYPDDYDPEEW